MSLGTIATVLGALASLIALDQFSRAPAKGAPARTTPQPGVIPSLPLQRGPNTIIARNAPAPVIATPSGVMALKHLAPRASAARAMTLYSAGALLSSNPALNAAERANPSLWYAENATILDPPPPGGYPVVSRHGIHLA